jgi:predicted phage terminase large subunit-like protein
VAILGDLEPMHPIKDKRARLRVAARYIKNGTVKFPRRGCEQLLTQLLGFGSEKHDDAVDALVYLILGLAGEGPRSSGSTTFRIVARTAQEA